MEILRLYLDLGGLEQTELHAVWSTVRSTLEHLPDLLACWRIGILRQAFAWKVAR